MNISLKSILLILLTVPTLASCIRDEIEDCPPLHVNIAVKDKNYFNADKVDMEERRAEDLAFREYVPTLFYMLRDAKTGEVVEEQGVFEVKGDEPVVPITFCECLPHGKYILTVWGGTDDLTTLNEDRTSLTLHPENVEGNDVYLVNDTLVYDAYNYDYTMEMERTKGKLVVLAEGLPEGFGKMDFSVDNIFGKVNSNFIYSGQSSVDIKQDFSLAPLVKASACLAPSRTAKGSVLDVNFFKTNDDPAHRTLSPDDVNISMERNTITMLKYVFEEDKVTIYIKVNDGWEEVHGMILD